MRHSESGIAFSRRISSRRKESLDPAHARMAGRRVRKSMDPVFTEQPSDDVGEPSKVLRPLHAQIPFVSTTYLIPPQSRQSHGHMLPGKFSDVVVGNRGRIGEWLVEAGNELWQNTLNICGDDELVMFGSITIRD